MECKQIEVAGGITGGALGPFFWSPIFKKITKLVFGLLHAEFDAEQGAQNRVFFCDFTFRGLFRKILLFSKSKSGEMLLTGGRGELSGQL